MAIFAEGTKADWIICLRQIYPTYNINVKFNCTDSVRNLSIRLFIYIIINLFSESTRLIRNRKYFKVYTK